VLYIIIVVVVVVAVVITVVLVWIVMKFSPGTCSTSAGASDVFYVEHATVFSRATRMHSAEYAVARCLSVRSSVCRSVTRRYSV